jgi:hypothetical protein
LIFLTGAVLITAVQECILEDPGLDGFSLQIKILFPNKPPLKLHKLTFLVKFLHLFWTNHFQYFEPMRYLKYLYQVMINLFQFY